MTRPKRQPLPYRIGSPVYDQHYALPATVAGFTGPLVHLVRPTGMSWTSRVVSVRPATPREIRQLRAIARLHAQQLRALKLPLPAGQHTESLSRPAA